MTGSVAYSAHRELWRFLWVQELMGVPSQYFANARQDTARRSPTHDVRLSPYCAIL